MITTIKSHDLEALRALRALRYRRPAPDCIKCGGSRVIDCDEGPDFLCADCGQTWLAEQQTGD